LVLKATIYRGFGILLAAAGLSAAAMAAAADKPFTVANYPVSARDKNAVAAKRKAHADGQQAAFISLFKRLVPVTAYHRMERLKQADSGQFIDGVAIRSERNSSTEYIASLDYSFQAGAVRDLLRREGVPFIDRQAPKVVLVPVVREQVRSAGEGAPLEPVYRKAGRSWNEAWSGLDLANTLTPLALKSLLPVVHSDTVAMLLSGGVDAQRILATEYQAQTILMAVAEVDRAGKRLHVTLAGSDSVGALNWKRSYRMADGDHVYAMELAAVISLGVLEGRWKAIQSDAAGGVDVMSGPASEVALAVRFSSLPEWNALREALLGTPGVDDVRIGGISARGADVSLRYPGGAALLASVLARQGITMQNDGSGWLVRSSF
jgi:Uncharacterized protein conserved in bacteria (DUF2066)